MVVEEKWKMTGEGWLDGSAARVAKISGQRVGERRADMDPRQEPRREQGPRKQVAVDRHSGCEARVRVERSRQRGTG